MMSHLTSFKVERKKVSTEIEPEFSSKAAWNGFTVRRYTRRSMYISERTLSDHTLQFNFGEPINFSWKSNGKWVDEYCPTGTIIELLSSGEKEELQWEGKFNTLEIAFDPAFVDDLLETQNFRFQEQRNIHDPLLKDIVTNLYEDTYSDAILQKMYAESIGITCVIHLATAYSIGGKKLYAPKGKLSSFQMKNVIGYIRSNLHGFITLEELAASTHLSVFHFSRLFKNTVGLSPYQFVLRMKIEHAKKLIIQKEPVGEIAYLLGFTDSAHFCNAFKKFTGLSPLQFLIGGL